MTSQFQSEIFGNGETVKQAEQDALDKIGTMYKNSVVSKMTVQGAGASWQVRNYGGILYLVTMVEVMDKYDQEAQDMIARNCPSRFGN